MASWNVARHDAGKQRREGESRGCGHHRDALAFSYPLSIEGNWRPGWREEEEEEEENDKVSSAAGQEREQDFEGFLTGRKQACGLVSLFVLGLRSKPLE